MTMDYSALPAKLTFVNNGAEAVKIPLFRINDYAYIPAGDTLVMAAQTSEQVIFYKNACEAIPNTAVTFTAAAME